MAQDISSQEFVMIMAGGGGTRLWPLSRRKRPKHLLTLGDDISLLAATFRRGVALVGAAHTLVVTAADQADSIRAALPQLPPDNLIVEPTPRNTCAAVALGAAAIARRAGAEARFAMLPSDAFIGDEAQFVLCARRALQHAGQAIVTLGIKPDHPETGYGYLRPGAAVAEGVVEVAAFVEKPDPATARRYVAEGYLWNAGIFVMSCARLFAETRRHLPGLADAVDEFLASNDFPAAVARLYPGVPSTSLDFGIMEKTQGIITVPSDIGWNDVGSWAALPVVRAAGEQGNITAGQTIAVDARQNILWSEPGAPLVAVTGVDDLVVVATRDAVLVTRRDRAQDVKKIVEALVMRGKTELL